ncbi:MAG TPA: SCP2 sterol-binding domain-containing protein [Myxococcota bacterium]|nr:SCP2 sterol-binding domain-containing protein [Myxococcota bacterium]
MGSTASYFEKRVPEAWNERLAEQEARGPEGAELLAKMRAADFALEVEIAEGDRFHLRVSGGSMRAATTVDPKPVVTLGLSEADCTRLEQSVGASPMSLLGGVAGNADFVLTPARLDLLREIQGTMRLEVQGEAPWGVVLHFGAPPIPAATTTVAIGDETFAQLLAGELDLQGAFMSGKLDLGGNVEVPMKMAMAIMSPE